MAAPASSALYLKAYAEAKIPVMGDDKSHHEHPLRKSTPAAFNGEDAA
jgi:hypothetical protein